MPDINLKLLEKLRDALAAGADERCGIVTRRGRLVDIPNIHAEPALGFHMEPSLFLAELQRGAVATWHTHPGNDPNLSEEDFAGFMQWPALRHHIIGIRDGSPFVHTFAVRDGNLVTVE